MKNICIGIDISKETFDATVIFAGDLATVDKLDYQQFKNQPCGYRSLVAWTRKLCKHRKATIDDCLFCLETTGGYDRHICSYLHEKSLHVWRESALQIHRSSGFRRGKNDKADSLNIATYAAKHQEKFVEFEPDSEAVAELKELVLYRDTLVNRKKQCETRLQVKRDTATDTKSATYKFIQKETTKEIEGITGMIEDVENQIKKVITADEEMSKHYQHVTSFKGISLVNASAIIAFSGDFKKIRTANKMSCYCGGVTFYDDSGTSVHKKDPDKNVCSKMLKNYLHMAAKNTLKYNKDIKVYADRLNAKGKPYGIVLNNVVNKILHILYSLVKNDCDYEEEHEKKLSASKKQKLAKAS